MAGFLICAGLAAIVAGLVAWYWPRPKAAAKHDSLDWPQTHAFRVGDRVTGGGLDGEVVVRSIGTASTVRLAKHSAAAKKARRAQKARGVKRKVRARKR